MLSTALSDDNTRRVVVSGIAEEVCQSPDRKKHCRSGEVNLPKEEKGLPLIQRSGQNDDAGSFWWPGCTPKWLAPFDEASTWSTLGSDSVTLIPTNTASDQQILNRHDRCCGFIEISDLETLSDMYVLWTFPITIESLLVR